MPSEKDYVQVLRDRGMQIGSYSWDPLVQWVKTVKLEKLQPQHKGKKQEPESKPSKQTESQVAEEEGAIIQDQNLRAKFGQWQENFEARLKTNPALMELAKKAYLASIRAYATHSSAEKHIFHPRRLHLGHLAATFGLAQPPSTFSSSNAKQSKQKDRLQDIKQGDKRNPRGKNGGAGALKRFVKRPSSATVSEFGAGDLSTMLGNKKPKLK